jgi:hypothetical protein
MKSNLHASYDYHADEEEEEQIDERVCELLNTSHNPCQYLNMTEAIGEDALAKHSEQIEEAMKQRDFLTLGRIIWNDITDYWEAQANSQAADEYNQTLG